MDKASDLMNAVELKNAIKTGVFNLPADAKFDIVVQKKVRPVSFNSDMASQVWSDRKTMTRRIVKDVNEKCPYGEVGDILWVREEHYVWGKWELVKDSAGQVQKTKLGREKWRFVPVKINECICYVDNPPEIYKKSRCVMFPDISTYYKRLARFMPKKYCRVYLEITGVRIERLKSISQREALKEGIKVIEGPVLCATRYKNYSTGGVSCMDPVVSFMTLWEKINGIGSWSENPWVWVIEFKRLKSDV